MFLGLCSRPAPVSQGLKTPGGPPTPAPCTGCLGSLEGQNSPPQRGRGTLAGERNGLYLGCGETYMTVMCLSKVKVVHILKGEIFYQI